MARQDDRFSAVEGTTKGAAWSEADAAALLASFQRLLAAVRLCACVAIMACWLGGGAQWFQGAFLGGLTVEVNLRFMRRMARNSPGWRGTSLAPTLVRFYLLFGVTALSCFVIVKYEAGHPLAFLAGLSSFFGGLVLGLISLALWKLPAGSAGGPFESRNDGKPGVGSRV
ncbi:MAG: ATP synthase subunit I [Candidatus Adiutrix sp.]|jgi:hypothetical protein|nr:ATP synthase subunit I [Candidatus Adiutrix sp.]